MRKLLALALLVFGLAVSQVAQAEPVFKWEHFGADKYAETQEEGMRTRAQAFRCAGLSDEAIGLLMKATEKPGKKVHLHKGDHLDVMLSKNCVAHHNVLVAWTRAPVRHMEWAAPGEQWEVTLSDGSRVIATRPDICNNWSFVIIPGPPPPPPPAPTQCAVEIVWVHAGGVLQANATAPEPVHGQACGPAWRVVGEDTWHLDFVRHCKWVYKTCGFENTLEDVRAEFGRDMQLDAYYAFSMQAPQDHGVFVAVRVPMEWTLDRSREGFLYCVTVTREYLTPAERPLFPDGMQTRARGIFHDNFDVNSIALVTDDSAHIPPPRDGKLFSGKPQLWKWRHLEP